jgi:hypothetical protein
MEWFMYNLERNVVHNVTAYVKFTTNTALFDPTGYGFTQHLSVWLNLKDVNGSYMSYVHVQTIDISLLATGANRTANWTVGFAPGQNPQYGAGNYASLVVVNQNLRKISFGCGAATLDAWLARWYYRTLPLSDANKEIIAPAPNFFSIIVGSEEIEYPISQWNTQQIISGALYNSGTLFIKFFKRNSETDLQLAIAGIPIYIAS